MKKGNIKYKVTFLPIRLSAPREQQAYLLLEAVRILLALKVNCTPDLSWRQVAWFAPCACIHMTVRVPGRLFAMLPNKLPGNLEAKCHTQKGWIAFADCCRPVLHVTLPASNSPSGWPDSRQTLQWVRWAFASPQDLVSWKGVLSAAVFWRKIE